MTEVVRSSIEISYPYTHSTGPVVGRALAALHDGVIVGARCTACARVGVPAREWCDRCGADAAELVPVGPAGTVRVAARVREPTALAPLDGPFSWAMIRLDGADTDMLHVVRGEAWAGDRVRPVWRAERRGAITDIESFETGDAPRVGVSQRVPERTIGIFERNVSLPYTLSAGSLLSRFFAEIRASRTIHGVRCTSCGTVIVPPSLACARCWADTEGWVALSDRGIVTTFVVVNVPFHGQRMPLPYVLARVLLDGADTSFLHVLGGVEPGDVRMGMRVEAVWRDERTGFPTEDIDHFRPTGEPDAPLGSFIDRL